MPVMTKDVSEALTRGIRRHMVNGDDSGLTEREKEVRSLPRARATKRSAKSAYQH